MKAAVRVLLLLSLSVAGFCSPVAIAGPGPGPGEPKKKVSQGRLHYQQTTDVSSEPLIPLEEGESLPADSRPCGCGGACNHDNSATLVNVRLPQFFFPEYGENVRMFWSESLVLVPGYRNLYQERQRSHGEQLVRLLGQSLDLITVVSAGFMRLAARLCSQALEQTLEKCLKRLEGQDTLPLSLDTYRYAKAPRHGVLIPAEASHAQLARLIIWALSKGANPLSASDIKELLEWLKHMSESNVHGALTSWTSQEEVPMNFISPGELQAYLQQPVQNQMLLISNHDGTAVFALVHDPNSSPPHYTVMPSSTTYLLWFNHWNDFVDFLLQENSHLFGATTPSSNHGWMLFNLGNVHEPPSRGLEGIVDFDEICANYSEDESEGDPEEEHELPVPRLEAYEDIADESDIETGDEADLGGRGRSGELKNL